MKSGERHEESGGPGLPAGVEDGPFCEWALCRAPLSGPARSGCGSPYAHKAAKPSPWGGPRRYTTDDRDLPKEQRHDLIIYPGQNGDWYVATDHEGCRGVLSAVRLCTSGGASTACPGLTNAIANAYRAMGGEVAESTSTKAHDLSSPARGQHYVSDDGYDSFTLSHPEPGRTDTRYWVTTDGRVVDMYAISPRSGWKVMWALTLAAPPGEAPTDGAELTQLLLALPDSLAFIASAYPIGTEGWRRARDVRLAFELLNKERDENEVRIASMRSARDAALACVAELEAEHAEALSERDAEIARLLGVGMRANGELDKSSPISRAFAEVVAVDVSEVADPFDAWSALGDICRAEANGAAEERAQFARAAAVAILGMVTCGGEAAMPDEILVDGLTPHPEVTLWGKATRQPDGTYQCFANVASSLCRIEVKISATDTTRREDAKWRGPYLARVDELTTARAKVNDLTAKLADAQAVAEMCADIATKERREVERLGAELEKERSAFIGANRAWSAAVATQEKAETERDEAKASAKRLALLAERNGEDAMAHAAKASRLQGELNEANARIFELEAQARLAENTALEKSE